MKAIKKKHYIIPIIICVLALAGLVFFYLTGSLSKSDKCEYVYIDDNDNLDSIAAKLKPIAKEQALLSFKLLARHSGYSKNIRTGKYAIDPEEGIFAVLRKLKNDSSFCAKMGYDTATIVCLFVPNTYEVYWNTPIENFLTRMKKEHDKFWNNDRQAKAAALGLNPNEVCTLASIIDEETSNNPEKPMIARMYLNRLKKGMPLQADPTVKFALKDFALKRIYHNMLNTDSPYNTYKNTGLPPGPIKVASVAGIDAVLNAPDHQYLYMCAKEDFSGTHNFASSYSEHLRNAAKYSKALNERGIK